MGLQGLLSRLSAVGVVVTLLQGSIPGHGNAQTIHYLHPDAASAGMAVVVEFVGPDSADNFGEDGLNSAEIVLLDPADSARVVIGPRVTSHGGKLLSVMFIVRKVATPGPIPVCVRTRQGSSNADSFYVVESQSLGSLTAGDLLGDGGRTGSRTRRNVLVVDSLVLAPGGLGISDRDPDPLTPGNQSYLPFTLLSIGPVRMDGDLSISGKGKDAIAGGGGGGGAAFGRGGHGFTGGGGDDAAGGDGSGQTRERNYDGAGSLNGRMGGEGLSKQTRPWDDQGGGGGTGYPYGTSGQAGTWYAEGGVSPDGGAGGGSAGGEHSQPDTSYGGGGGGNFTDGGTGSLNGNNRGRKNGNAMLVPLFGGSGGGAGNMYGGGEPGDGGAGGGALHIYGMSSVIVRGALAANGADGESTTTGSAAGGGGGAGGAIALSSRETISFDRATLSALGGRGGTALHRYNLGGYDGGDGALGRVRLAGHRTGSVTVSTGSSYNGPTVDLCETFDFEYSKLEGTGEAGDSILVFRHSGTSGWDFDRPIATKVRPDGTWRVGYHASGFGENIVAVLQQVRSPDTALFSEEPQWVMTHASGGYVCPAVFPATVGGGPAEQLSIGLVEGGLEIGIPHGLKTATITISNLLGEIVLRREVESVGGGRQRIPLDALVPGVYFARAHHVGFQKELKFQLLR